jgi:hypothetical protein
VHQPPGPGYETVDRDSGRLPQYGYTASGWSQGGVREVTGFAGVRAVPGSPADVPTSLFDALMAESADRAADGAAEHPADGYGHLGAPVDGRRDGSLSVSLRGPVSGSLSDSLRGPLDQAAPNGHSRVNGYGAPNGPATGHTGPDGYGGTPPGTGPREPESGGDHRHGDGLAARPALSFLDGDPLDGADPDHGRHRRPE